MHGSEHLPLLEPPDFSDDAAAEWFKRIASACLNDVQLLVDGQRHRLVEMEAYYLGESHPDPFTHCDPLQRTTGQWYFHRSGKSYRGGSFKGVDLTFGSSAAYGGMLVRSLETPSGDVINGPSLCVDYLLKQTGLATVAELDQAVNDNPQRLSFVPIQSTSDTAERTIYATARVGLTLKKATAKDRRFEYLFRPYRFLTRPREVRKGKLHTIAALHLAGHDVATIRQLTNSPQTAITRYIEAFASGQQLSSHAEFIGKDLSNDDLMKLHGYWQASRG